MMELTNKDSHAPDSRKEWTVYFYSDTGNVVGKTTMTADTKEAATRHAREHLLPLYQNAESFSVQCDK